MKPLTQDQIDFIQACNEALRKDLKTKQKKIEEQACLIAYYEEQLEISKPATRGNPPPHIKYPDCFKPLNKFSLS
ncbi:hypothetical protein [Christiangramia sp.]|uniref:hypothetical protein n=1 Tax=Christiangramia sp. TaxID=1931228 RepID=UPI00261CAF13|nr:hypothetical protein [Christiangramia sp.]